LLFLRSLPAVPAGENGKAIVTLKAIVSTCPSQENKFRVCKPCQTDTDDIQNFGKQGHVEKKCQPDTGAGFGMLREDSDGWSVVCCMWPTMEAWKKNLVAL